MRYEEVHQTTTLTGFAPRAWSWASEQSPGGAVVTLTVQSSGLYTLSLLTREDGLQLDRLLLTTDTTYIPTGFGPSETPSLAEPAFISTTITRTIVYTYDNLYRLTGAVYSTGEIFHYTYDAGGNCQSQVANTGGAVDYFYTADNHLAQVISDPAQLSSVPPSATMAPGGGWPRPMRRAEPPTMSTPTSPAGAAPADRPM